MKKKPFAINSFGVLLFNINDGKAKWQKGCGRTTVSKIRFDEGNATYANAPYFMARGTKQYLHQFYKVK